LEALAYSASFALISAVLFLLAKAFDKRIALVCALAAAAYLGLDDLITGLPPALRSLHFPGVHWNWTGKLLSLGLSAVVISVLRLRPEAVGLTFRWRNGRIGVLALVFFIVWGACLGLLFKPGAPDLETLAFQATMPGLAEELVYRGILPAILLWRIAKAGDPEGMPWAVIMATAVAFGVCHGLSLSGGHFGFDVMSALFPFLGSIPGGWLRFKTRSLVFPIAAHSLANVAFHLAGTIRG
jgi:hypothetical protein